MPYLINIHANYLLLRTTKNLPVGHYLQGTISYAKDELGKKADVYKFKYIMPESAKKNKGESSKDKEKEKQKAEDLDDAMRDFSISWLAKLGEVFTV